MRPNVIIFGTENFNKSFNEIKGHLNFKVYFFDSNLDEKKILTNSIILVDAEAFQDTQIEKKIENLKDNNFLLIEHPTKTLKFNCSEKMTRPFDLVDLNKKLTQMTSSLKFNKNSSIIIKDYILDKNEKKLKKGSIYVVLTEREIQLIELLFNQKKSISKSSILKEVWKYADDADTHTVETHVYRLRKKIKEKFSDDKLIINNQEGYLI
tara:strand:+ start:288 stop:914 length:627 start_codon:yes stop_codon:yes gene_type:complete